MEGALPHRGDRIRLHGSRNRYHPRIRSSQGGREDRGVSRTRCDASDPALECLATLHVQVGINNAATPAPPSIPTANTNMAITALASRLYLLWIVDMESSFITIWGRSHSWGHWRRHRPTSGP